MEQLQVRELSLPKNRLIPLMAGQDSIAKLIVAGQGVVNVSLIDTAPFCWTFYSEDKSKGIKVEVNNKGVYLYKNSGKTDKWDLLEKNELKAAALEKNLVCEQVTVHSQYWISIDSLNNKITYGKGEMRPDSELLAYTGDYIQEKKGQRNSWMHQVQNVQVIHDSPLFELFVWRDPVTISPPLAVKSSNQITMDDVALYRATVIENLPPACQQLYANVAGDEFHLNTPDFPQFSDAIQASILDPNGWCHKTLIEKQGELGHDPNETYLRITMGVNQGDSPGIPYVMEIWPNQHYSPMHNHAGANAIIKVLSGIIDVQLYPMLSPNYEDHFKLVQFGEGEVTWITPALNQTHKLINRNPSGAVCITIQCYMYPNDDTQHYEYFDYIEGDCVKQFQPNSDMDFIQFKMLMKQEWEARQSAD